MPQTHPGKKARPRARRWPKAVLNSGKLYSVCIERGLILPRGRFPNPVSLAALGSALGQTWTSSAASLVSVKGSCRLASTLWHGLTLLSSPLDARLWTSCEGSHTDKQLLLQLHSKQPHPANFVCLHSRVPPTLTYPFVTVLWEASYWFFSDSQLLLVEISFHSSSHIGVRLNFNSEVLVS